MKAIIKLVLPVVGDFPTKSKFDFLKNDDSYGLREPKYIGGPFNDCPSLINLDSHSEQSVLGKLNQPTRNYNKSIGRLLVPSEIKKYPIKNDSYSRLGDYGPTPGQIEKLYGPKLKN